MLRLAKEREELAVIMISLVRQQVLNCWLIVRHMNSCGTE